MSQFVSPKKHLGQHFLRDENIAKKTVAAFLQACPCKTVVEVGAGTGVLTKYLLQEKSKDLFVVEVDRESVAFLTRTYPELKDRIIERDFLQFDPAWLPEPASHSPFAVIGNFPYNISSQILFKVLEFRNQVPEVVGMFQKEVAQRIASPPGSKTYGILSVLMQAWFNIEYLFTVHENVFLPPPKVKSAVIRLTRHTTAELDCNEDLFFQVVKTAFNQRRKTLKNALSKYTIRDAQSEMLAKRAEQLSVQDFVELTKMIGN